MTKRTVIQDCLMFFSCCLGLTPNRFQEKYKKTARKSAVIVKDWFEAQQQENSIAVADGTARPDTVIQSSGFTQSGRMQRSR